MVVEAVRTHRAVGYVDGALFDEIQLGRLLQAEGDLADAELLLDGVVREAAQLGLHSTALEAAIHLAVGRLADGRRGGCARGARDGGGAAPGRTPRCSPRRWPSSGRVRWRRPVTRPVLAASWTWASRPPAASGCTTSSGVSSSGTRTQSSARRVAPSSRSSWWSPFSSSAEAGVVLAVDLPRGHQLARRRWERWKRSPRTTSPPPAGSQSRRARPRRSGRSTTAPA